MKTMEEIISTEELLKVMNEQWKGIENILEEVDRFMIGIKTHDFFLMHNNGSSNYFINELYADEHRLSMLHLMDIAYAHNVTISGLLATSYERWIKDELERMIISQDWDEEFHLHDIVVDLLWKEHDKWSKIIVQTKEFKV